MKKKRKNLLMKIMIIVLHIIVIMIMTIIMMILMIILIHIIVIILLIMVIIMNDFPKLANAPHVWSCVFPTCAEPSSNIATNLGRLSQSVKLPPKGAPARPRAAPEPPTDNSTLQ